MTFTIARWALGFYLVPCAADCPLLDALKESNMLYVTATINAQEETAKVLRVHHTKPPAEVAKKLHEGGLTMSIPVSMARPRSVTPRKGDVLPLAREASGLVAVAPVCA